MYEEVERRYGYTHCDIRSYGSTIFYDLEKIPQRKSFVLHSNNERFGSRVGKNPGFFKKPNPVGFFGFYWVLLGFFGFFWVFYFFIFFS